MNIFLNLPFFAGLVGCGGGPDEEQLKQLADLKAEVEKLQSDVSKVRKRKS